MYPNKRFVYVYVLYVVTGYGFHSSNTMQIRPGVPFAGRTLAFGIDGLGVFSKYSILEVQLTSFN